jgi:5'-3' exoribonuclease 4
VNTLELRQNLKDVLRTKQDLIKRGASNHDKVSHAYFERYFACVSVLTYPLQIRLGLPGWKSRFYREKFGVENYNEVGKLKNNMVKFFLFLFLFNMVKHIFVAC